MVKHVSTIHLSLRALRGHEARRWSFTLDVSAARQGISTFATLTKGGSLWISGIFGLAACGSSLLPM